MKLKKTKQQHRNPFFDDKQFEKDVIGFARPRKGRSSNIEFLDKLEDSIYNKIREGKLTYREIIDLVAEKAKVKISMGYLTNLKKKFEEYAKDN